jgi:integrase
VAGIVVDMSTSYLYTTRNSRNSQITSLRAGLATSAAADEGAVQKQLGHASPEMTRRYQRNRDRFRINLTKAAGL